MISYWGSVCGGESGWLSLWSVLLTQFVLNLAGSVCTESGWFSLCWVRLGQLCWVWLAQFVLSLEGSACDASIGWVCHKPWLRWQWVWPRLADEPVLGVCIQIQINLNPMNSGGKVWVQCEPYSNYGLSLQAMSRGLDGDESAWRIDNQSSVSIFLHGPGISLRSALIIVWASCGQFVIYKFNSISTTLIISSKICTSSKSKLCHLLLLPFQSAFTIQGTVSQDFCVGFFIK